MLCKKRGNVLWKIDCRIVPFLDWFKVGDYYPLPPSLSDPSRPYYHAIAFLCLRWILITKFIAPGRRGGGVLRPIKRDQSEFNQILTNIVFIFPFEICLVAFHECWWENFNRFNNEILIDGWCNTQNAYSHPLQDINHPITLSCIYWWIFTDQNNCLRWYMRQVKPKTYSS